MQTYSGKPPKEEEEISTPDDSFVPPTQVRECNREHEMNAISEKKTKQSIIAYEKRARLRLEEHQRRQKDNTRKE